jgi:anthranilate/para-aminobenzoate synthase component I
LIRALFPGGTIAGCPKVRCMEMSEYCLEVGAGIVANSNSERE